jgi:transcriptional regulator with XRE-family HTH domain
MNMLLSLTIDEHVGRKLRHRRQILGMTQQQVAVAVGVRFQQIQKYECGANKISAGRLWSLSQALEVAPGYFFEGLRPAVDDDASDFAALDVRNASPIES